MVNLEDGGCTPGWYGLLYHFHGLDPLLPAAPATSKSSQHPARLGDQTLCKGLEDGYCRSPRPAVGCLGQGLASPGVWGSA